MRNIKKAKADKLGKCRSDEQNPARLHLISTISIYPNKKKKKKN